MITVTGHEQLWQLLPNSCNFILHNFTSPPSRQSLPHDHATVVASTPPPRSPHTHTHTQVGSYLAGLGANAGQVLDGATSLGLAGGCRRGERPAGEAVRDAVAGGREGGGDQLAMAGDWWPHIVYLRESDTHTHSHTQGQLPLRPVYPLNSSPTSSVTRPRPHM